MGGSNGVAGVGREDIPSLHSSGMLGQAPHARHQSRWPLSNLGSSGAPSWQQLNIALPKASQPRALAQFPAHLNKQHSATHLQNELLAAAHGGHGHPQALQGHANAGPEASPAAGHAGGGFSQHAQHPQRLHLHVLRTGPPRIQELGVIQGVCQGQGRC